MTSQNESTLADNIKPVSESKPVKRVNSITIGILTAGFIVNKFSQLFRIRH